MPKKTKKSSRPIKEKGSSATQEFDYDKFKVIFDKWQNDCKVSGSKLGLTSSATLLEIVNAHGVVARPYTKSPVSKDKGAGTIIELMEEWENDIAVLETVDLIALDEVIEKLNAMANSENDPRNIRFTVPILSEVNPDNGDYDEDDVTEVYGHYRTPDYIAFRKILADLPNSKINPESIEAVDSSWYAEGTDGKNTAEPPMWQALFATSGDIVSLGLLGVCQEAKKLIKETEIHNVILKVHDSGDGLLAEEVYKLPAVKSWLASKVGSSTSPGDGINPKTLHWKDRPMHSQISSEKFDVQGLAQSKFIKRAANFNKYAGTITTFQLDISRRQTRKLATLTGVCKKYKGRDVVYHVSKDAKKSKKTKKEVKKWMEIIGR